jgi:hypothetical protein
VVRGEEEARASRWRGATAAAAIKAGLGAWPLQGEEEGEGLGGAGLVLGALKEKGRRREEARGREAVGGRRGREVGRRLEVEDGPDR